MEEIDRSARMLAADNSSVQQTFISSGMGAKKMLLNRYKAYEGSDQSQSEDNEIGTDDSERCFGNQDSTKTGSSQRFEDDVNFGNFGPSLNRIGDFQTGVQSEATVTSCDLLPALKPSQVSLLLPAPSCSNISSPPQSEHNLSVSSIDGESATQKIHRTDKITPDTSKGARPPHVIMAMEMSELDENKDKNMEEIIQDATRTWYKMSPLQKSPYIKMSKLELARYREEKTKLSPPVVKTYPQRKHSTMNYVSPESMATTSPSPVVKKKMRMSSGIDKPRGARPPHIIFSLELRNKRASGEEVYGPEGPLNARTIWNSMSAEDQAPYRQQAHLEQAKYKQEMAVYRARLSHDAQETTSNGIETSTMSEQPERLSPNNINGFRTEALTFNTNKTSPTKSTGMRLKKPRGARPPHLIFAVELRKKRAASGEVPGPEGYLNARIIWNAMSPKEQAPYRRQAKMEQARYKREKATYRAKLFTNGQENSLNGVESSQTPSQHLPNSINGLATETSLPNTNGPTESTSSAMRLSPGIKKPRGARPPHIIFCVELRNKRAAGEVVYGPEGPLNATTIWNSMSAEDQAPYRQQAHLEQAKYKQEMAVYRARLSHDAQENGSNPKQPDLLSPSNINGLSTHTSVFSSNATSTPDLNSPTNPELLTPLPPKPKGPCPPHMQIAKELLDQPEYAGRHMKEVIPEATRRWREMDPESKAPYSERFEASKQRYKEELRAYIQTHGANSLGRKKKRGRPRKLSVPDTMLSGLKKPGRPRKNSLPISLSPGRCNLSPTQVSPKQRGRPRIFSNNNSPVTPKKNSVVDSTSPISSGRTNISPVAQLTPKVERDLSLMKSPKLSVSMIGPEDKKNQWNNDIASLKFDGCECVEGQKCVRMHGDRHVNGKTLGIHYHCQRVDCSFTTEYFASVIRHEAMKHSIVRPGLKVYSCLVCTKVTIHLSEYCRHLNVHLSKGQPGTFSYDYALEEILKCSEMGVKVTTKSIRALKPATVTKSAGVKLVIKKQKLKAEEKKLKAGKNKKWKTKPAVKCPSNLDFGEQNRKNEVGKKYQQFELSTEGLKLVQVERETNNEDSNVKVGEDGKFHCSACDFATTVKPSYYRHRIAVHNMKPINTTYYCSFCDLGTTNRYDFMRHCQGLKHIELVKNAGLNTDEVLKPTSVGKTKSPVKWKGKKRKKKSPGRPKKRLKIPMDQEQNVESTEVQPSGFPDYDLAPSVPFPIKDEPEDPSWDLLADSQRQEQSWNNDQQDEQSDTNCPLTVISAASVSMDFHNNLTPSRMMPLVTPLKITLPKSPARVSPQKSPAWDSQQKSPAWDSQQKSPTWDLPMKAPSWVSPQKSPSRDSPQKSPAWFSPQKSPSLDSPQKSPAMVTLRKSPVCIPGITPLTIKIRKSPSRSAMQRSPIINPMSSPESPVVDLCGDIDIINISDSSCPSTPKSRRGSRRNSLKIERTSPSKAVRVLEFEETVSDCEPTSDNDCIIGDVVGIREIGQITPIRTSEIPRNIDMFSSQDLLEELVQRRRLATCVCGMSFMHRGMLERHAVCHGASNDLMCASCGVVFENWLEFHMHISRHGK